MAIIHPVDPRYVITSVDNNSFLVLGTAGEKREAGFWRIAFAPDSSWVGGLAILARCSGKAASDDGVGYGTIAYRQVQVNGIAQDPSILVQVGSPAVPLVNKDFIIWVPGSGLQVAIGVDWTAGFGTLYTEALLDIPI